VNADGNVGDDPAHMAKMDEFASTHDSIIDTTERMSTNAQNGNFPTDHAMSALNKRLTDLKILGQKLGGDINNESYQELTDYIQSVTIAIAQMKKLRSGRR